MRNEKRLAPRRKGAKAPRGKDAKTRRGQGAKAPKGDDTTTPRHHDARVQGCHDATENLGGLSKPKQRGEKVFEVPGGFPWLEEVPVYKILVALALLVLLAYANSLRGEFVFDDSKQILNNPSLRGPLDWDKAFTTDVWAFQKTYSTDIPPPYYRPIFTIWLSLGYHLFRLWTPGWHLLSLLLHGVTTLWVFWTTREFTGMKSPAVLTAMMFAVHPIHTESVAWVSAVPDPLVAVFFLPSLYFYHRARSSGSVAAWSASLVAFALSTLSKENALSVPLIVLGWEWFSGDTTSGAGESAVMGRLGKAVQRASGFMAIALVYLVARYQVLGLITWKHPFDRGLTNFIAWISVPQVFLAYLWHLIFPFRLSLFYNVYFVRTPASTAFWGPVILLVALAGMAWRWWRAIGEELRPAVFPAVLFGLLVWIAPMLPVLNLKAFNEEYLVQDRYMYVPSIGFCLLASLLLLNVGRKGLRKALRAGVIGAVLVFFLASNIWQNTVWATSISLWTRAEAYRPDSWSAHYNRGLALSNHHRYAEAETELKAAAELNPQRAIIFNNLGLAQTELSKDADARGSFERAIRLNPRLVEAYINLGALEYRMQQLPLARQSFQKALTLDPTSTAALYNGARLDMDQGNFGDAMKEWNQLLQLNPWDAEARWRLGITLKALHRPEEARQQWQQALHDAVDDTLRQKILADLKQ